MDGWIDRLTDGRSDGWTTDGRSKRVVALVTFSILDTLIDLWTDRQTDTDGRRQMD